MFAVQQAQQQGFVPDALRQQGLMLQQQQQQLQSQQLQQQQQAAWLQQQAAQRTQQMGMMSMMMSPAQQQPQQQVAVFQQHPQQQVRLAQVPISAAQVPQQRQAYMLAPQAAQQVLAPQAGGAGDNNKQVVYVNVNGTLQRGIVQNGAVYLLPNDGGARPQQVGAMQQLGNASLGLQQAQPQQPMMVQQVLPNGQLVPVSGALVAPRGAGVQLMPPQPQQPQQAAVPTQLQVRAMPPPAVTMGMQLQQQQPVMRMDAGVGATVATQRVVPANARMLQQQAAAPRGPVMPQALGNNSLAASRPMLLGGTPVSASTASLMPRMPASSAAATAAVGSQPMTIAAALAALPSSMAPAGGAAAAAAPAANPNDLCSPVARPGTPGMGGAPAAAPTAVSMGVVASKLAAPDTGSAGPAILSGPAIGGTTGPSPLTSHPGTPPRSNSVGDQSSSSSSSSSSIGGGSQGAGADADSEAKAGVMRMLARTFLETGIGLDQALGMVQPADASMLAAAFEAEAAARPAAGGAAAGPTMNAGPTTTEVCAAAGGPGLQGLPAASGASGGDAGGQDGFSLGGWGFSLFSNAASDVGSSFGGGGGDKASSADADFAATASMFANLHV